MKRETRTAVYDDALQVEAYRFRGILRPFPNHFHEYYVIGLVERGERRLSCKNREYDIQKGSILLFNPGDSHACVQSSPEPLDYRAINISRDVMPDLVREVSGRRELPGFSETVLRDGEIACCLRSLHEMVLERHRGFDKEEQLLLLLSLLIWRCGEPFPRREPACREEVERACRFMEAHFHRHISLDQLCRCAGLSKSGLLRAFTRAKGVTPYSYLQNVRVGAAKRLLEQGLSPAEAALQTGFSDQSHFTNYFSRFMGLTPGAYREIFSVREGKETAFHAASE